MGGVYVGGELPSPCGGGDDGGGGGSSGSQAGVKRESSKGTEVNWLKFRHHAGIAVF